MVLIKYKQLYMYFLFKSISYQICIFLTLSTLFKNVKIKSAFKILKKYLDLGCDDKSILGEEMFVAGFAIMTIQKLLMLFQIQAF